MKHIRIFLALALMLTGIVVAAQDLANEFTSTGGLTFSYPDGLSVEELSPNVVGVLDEANQEGVLVMTGEGVLELAGLTQEDAGDLLTASFIFEALGTQGLEAEPTEITLANGTGLTASGELPNLGTGTVIVIETESGLIVGIIIAESGSVSEAFVETATAIVGSASFDPANATVVETPTDAPDIDTPDTDVEGEEGCPIAVADMPEGVIQFCGGVELTLAEGWGLLMEDETVETFTSLSTENARVTASVSVSEISSFYSPEVYKTDSISFIAEAAGDTEYDPVESWTVVLEEEGRLVEVYDPRTVLEIEENDFVQVVYLVKLNNDLFVAYNFSYLEGFAQEEEIASIEEIALSTVLNDTYTGSPATIELDGESFFVTELTCGESSYSFSYTEDETYVVSCPICAGDEGSVWGTDIYTDDSSVCLAAAHAGSISLEVGGLVLVSMSEGLESYTGSEANGITSSDYGTWGNSFSTAPVSVPGE
ncbi:MAG: LCCL domain-containing protein [Anaerolineae bacterium]|jgi:hypothetical protein|nr:LCCL domain-containing protein [Anaerolineae bacterium]